MLSKLMRWSGSAFVVGGLLWMTHYALQVVMGTATGVPPVERGFSFSPIPILDLVSFGGAILLFVVGLLGIASRLGGRSRKLGVAGTVFALIAGAAILSEAVLVSGVFWESILVGGLLGIGVIGSLAAATLLSVAALRTGVMARRAGRLLLAAGLATFPAIIAAGLLAAFVPAYMTDELPFAVSGVAWALVGRELLREREAPLMEPEPAR